MSQRTPAATPRPRITGGTNWLIVAATGIAVFMAQLDATVVNVALPTIEAELGIGTSLTQWIVLGYVLPMIALSLLRSCSPRHLLGTTGASTSLARQLGIAFGPALATTLWALPGYDLTGMRTAMAFAAGLAALSVIALLRTPRAVSAP